MARSPQPTGTCVFCNRSFAKGGLRRHLASCTARAAANAAAQGAPQRLYYLRATDGDGTPFWLDLEVRGGARLRDIDAYLRHIWLECCGHLSQFAFESWGEELAMSATVERTFNRASKLYHQYDFGTTSETVIELVAVREGAPLSPHPIFLMARNNMPEAVCMVCGAPAEYLCLECIYEHDDSGMLCETHADEHPHEGYGELHTLFNSPRVGLCGELMTDTPPY